MAKSTPEQYGWKNRRQYENFVKRYNKAFPSKAITGNKYFRAAKIKNVKANRDEIRARNNGWNNFKDYVQYKQATGQKRIGPKQAFLSKQRSRESYAGLPQVRGQDTWTSANSEYKKYKSRVDSWSHNKGKYAISNLDFLDLSEPAQYQLHASVFNMFSRGMGVVEVPSREVVMAYQKFYYVYVLEEFTEEEWDDKYI